MPVRHKVTLSDPHAHLVTISSTFSGAGAPLPDPLVLAMPVWTPGSYLVREYARNVELPRATSSDERSVSVTKLRKNAWSIAHGGAGEVTFSYELYCNDLSVRTNHVDLTHVYLNGAASFTFAAHEPDAGADVSIDTPSGWRVATALSQQGPSASPVYRAQTPFNSSFAPYRMAGSWLQNRDHPADGRVLDQACDRIHLDLQLHHVAARRRPDHAGTDRVVALVERTHVARVLIVLDHFFAVCHVVLLIAGPAPGRSQAAPHSRGGGCGVPQRGFHAFSVQPTGWC